MARTRFLPDTGLTVRMTTVMFLLGGLFVAVVVGLMYAVQSPGLSLLIGVAGLGDRVLPVVVLRQGGHARHGSP